MVFWLSSFRRKKKEHLLTVKTQYSSHGAHSSGQSFCGERTDSVVFSVTSTNTQCTCHQEPCATMQQYHAVAQRVKTGTQSKKYCSMLLNNEHNFLSHYRHIFGMEYFCKSKSIFYSTLYLRILLVILKAEKKIFSKSISGKILLESFPGLNLSLPIKSFHPILL